MTYNYDSLNRVTREGIRVDQIDGYSKSYEYADGAAGGTTGLVSKITYQKRVGNPETLSYTYDDAGNIETIKENGVLKATYHYDQFGQLVREDNAWAGRTYLYHYDAGGNLKQVQECQYRTDELHQTDLIGNTNYSYATGTETDGNPVWKDLLISYNGTTIKYDAIGNPLNWNGVSNLAWSNGRRLTALRKGITTASYVYDETGFRTRKVVTGTQTWFDRDAAGNLVHETRNNGKDHLYYYYDANGSIGSISYNGVRYAFLKNLQGDVIAILDTNSNIVARYTYDAWGKVLSVTDANGNANTSSTFIGNVNPIRYRGYYYDKETGWYLTGTRYYDPMIGRFISADSVIPEPGSENAIVGSNMFAYCFNNPVNMNDQTGHWPKWLKAVATAVVAVAVVATVAAVTVASGGSAVPVIVGAAVGAVSSGAIDAATQYKNTGK